MEVRDPGGIAAFAQGLSVHPSLLFECRDSKGTGGGWGRLEEHRGSAQTAAQVRYSRHATECRKGQEMRNYLQRSST